MNGTSPYCDQSIKLLIIDEHYFWGKHYRTKTLIFRTTKTIQVQSRFSGIIHEISGFQDVYMNPVLILAFDGVVAKADEGVGILNIVCEHESLTFNSKNSSFKNSSVAYFTLPPLK